MAIVQGTLFGNSDNQPAKICTKCGVEKTFDQFNKDKSKKDGVTPWCKECWAEHYANLPEDKKKERLARCAEYQKINREKYNELARRQRKARPHIGKKASARYNATHIEERRRYCAKYHTENQEQISKRKAVYREENPEVVSKHNAKRRALLAGATIGDLNAIAKWERSWRKKDCVTCYWCGGEFSGTECQSDHYIPLSKGGPHHVDNLVIACALCNIQKRDKMPEEFEKWLTERRNS